MLFKGVIVGFGNVALKAHVPVWEENPHFTIGAVVEPDAERAGLAAKALPKARLYADLAAVCDRGDIDFVDICTPPSLHLDGILEACRAGLHVLCEKPLLPCMESLENVQQTANRMQRVVFTVNNWKYAPIWQKVFELVHDNSIGAVRSVQLSVLRPPNSGGGASDWRRCAETAGGGILLDHGWHHLYLVRTIMRQSPLAVSAVMETAHDNGGIIEETVDLRLRFPSAEASIYLTWKASRRLNHGTITGDKGVLRINDDHVILTGRDAQDLRFDFSHPLSQSSHHSDWMKPVVDDFYREIAGTGTAGANFTEAQQCAYLTSLAYQSHREGGRPVPIEWC